jgi:hypothetical protein
MHAATSTLTSIVYRWVAMLVNHRATPAQPVWVARERPVGTDFLPPFTGASTYHPRSRPHPVVAREPLMVGYPCPSQTGGAGSVRAFALPPIARLFRSGSALCARVCWAESPPGVESPLRRVGKRGQSRFRRPSSLTWIAPKPLARLELWRLAVSMTGPIGPAAGRRREERRH